MNKVLRVKVEYYHIICGKPNAGEKCPVALALTAMLPAGQRALVGLGFFSVCVGEKTLLSTHDLPDEATRFIRAFDSGDKVEPFEFALPLEA